MKLYLNKIKTMFYIYDNISMESKIIFSSSCFEIAQYRSWYLSKEFTRYLQLYNYLLFCIFWTISDYSEYRMYLKTQVEPIFCKFINFPFSQNCVQNFTNINDNDLTDVV